MRLCIDPGHGGSDPGGTGYGKQEKNIVLDISYAMMHQATARGLQAILTRTGDKDVPINVRYEIANHWGADLFMSVHTNASGGRGIECLYGKERDKSLAAMLSAELCRVTGWPMRRGDGTWYRPKVGVLRGTLMPAVLSECGFIDVPEENTAMSDPAWTERVAEAHINIACGYLGIIPGEEEEMIYNLERLPKQGNLFVWGAADVFTRIDNPRHSADYLCWLNIKNESPDPVPIEIFGTPELAAGHPLRDTMPPWEKRGYDIYALNGNRHFNGSVIVKANQESLIATMTMLRLK